jgi:peptidoglycan/LPS O-acetylase OafA/YrhL
LALATTLLLLYLLVAVPAQLFAWSISMGLLAMIAATLVCLASYGKGYLFGYKGLTGPMQWLGARSYGIYLIHMPVFKFTHEAAARYLQATGQSNSLAMVPILLLLAGALIAVLAELNFRYVEEPLRRRGAERAKRKLTELETDNSADKEFVLTSNQDKQRTSA